jgi:hypothetical protein
MKNNRDRLTRYIGESSQKIREYLLFKTIPVIIQDPLPDGFDISVVLSKIEDTIPVSFMYMVDCIYVGQFDVFTTRQVNAVYEDGAIYVTNHQDDEEDMIDDLFHEISHSVEEMAEEYIYGDNLLRREYLVKKERLYDILREHVKEIESWRKSFFTTEFDKDFDEFLYISIGYPLLSTLSAGLYLSPYSITSLREYFAKGFEHFYLDDREYVKKTCPMLYNKIYNLTLWE